MDNKPPIDEIVLTVSIGDLSLSQLMALNKDLCDQANRLRQQIRYVSQKIEARVADSKEATVRPAH